MQNTKLNFYIINIKYLFNPPLLIVLTTICFFLLFCSFEVTLCDELALDNLKAIIEKDILEYNNVINRFNGQINILKQMKADSERNYALEQDIYTRLLNDLKEISSRLTKMNQTESIIKQ